MESFIAIIYAYSLRYNKSSILGLGVVIIVKWRFGLRMSPTKEQGVPEMTGNVRHISKADGNSLSNPRNGNRLLNTLYVTTPGQKGESGTKIKYFKTPNCWTYNPVVQSQIVVRLLDLNSLQTFFIFLINMHTTLKICFKIRHSWSHS